MMPAHTADHSQPLTQHAHTRMTTRNLSPEAIAATLDFGRSIHTRGAEIYVIGRKEVEQYRQRGIDLSSFEGVQLVCAADGAILTVYRNRDFRRLRPRSRPWRRCSKWVKQLQPAN